MDYRIQFRANPFDDEAPVIFFVIDHPILPQKGDIFLLGDIFIHLSKTNLNDKEIDNIQDTYFIVDFAAWSADELGLFYICECEVYND